MRADQRARRDAFLGLIGTRPVVMGVLNVTPDSFSDGRLFQPPDAAVAQAGKMIGEGADIIDVGAESSRPGAVAVCETDELARLVVNAIDDDASPETASVLSDAPSLVLEPAVLRRGHELHLRLPGRDVRRGIEGREVATDDLVRLVALELPRADVPGQDLAVRVEGEDGIVADARDEQSIELGGFVRTLVSSGVGLIVLRARRGHEARKRRRA